jgi:hypothetical protein
VAADPALVALADDQVLARATGDGRAVVTANIKDLVALDRQYRAAGRSHAGLILVSAKTFPQDRRFVGAMTAALAMLLASAAKIQPGEVTFLSRA